MRRTIDKAPKPLELQPIALVQRAFPDKPGCIRRIHVLWGNSFRINYHAIDEGNVIRESHFVQVIDGTIAELN